ncbi:homoserine kinase [Pyrococcus furiosus DSM 3638]|uniref:Homoserine kinase n=3 Tax=Pyrococcus furiosus TaxID=2261 RepID=KHSE_PYRFU|nr:MULTISPECIES: homoserine kinase [Pyrococcus]Q8U1Z9.1 RecName: Full=Homoserine kinase; Short=HK; Short=HSK [Pyrococcus furiosus DSM 3638]AAL81178.1 homoserine kinase [Pyrococcus furiosus DSM 3638]AFN03850.1 homoserine kinase [Pyrococcus furiosus COM1]MDK2868821.1 homoserine kinase [Pyrococcus sp.]QEK78715.1 homoserine kinase [Pyrococcus furiosus DSM 3638]
MKVYAPATIANFGPGFDVFGLAIETPRDTVIAKESDDFRIEVEGYKVPENDENVALVAAKALFKLVGEEGGIYLKLKKGIRPKSGLGSSGASSIAGAVAAARILGVEDDEIIIRAALEGERKASGSPHGDNVVPSYYGNFTIVESLNPLRVHNIEVDFKVVVILPSVEVPTSEARKVLPKKVPLKDAVKNIALASSLVLALKEGNLEEVGRLLEDHLALPYRLSLVPWFPKVKEAAKEAGAYGVMISGSGPAVFALGENLKEIGKAMKEAFESFGIEAEYWVTKVGRGAKWC